MSRSAPGPNDDAAATLARSLFGFALLFCAPAVIAFAMILLSPASPDAAYARIRLAIVAAFGLAAAILVVVTIRAYRWDAALQDRLARSIASLFGRGWLALVLILALAELNVLALVTLPDIAPAITGPARFLLLCWTLAFAGLLLTVHWRGVRGAVMRWRDSLAGVAILMFCLALPLLMLIATSRLDMAFGWADRLRGALDYRPLEFIAEGAPPSAQRFWMEQGRTRVRWLPYSYWTVEPFAGAFINVDSRGLRHTPRFGADAASPRVAFFGGSTMWGEGARDGYTIPAQVARSLADADVPALASNYAQTGYVSAQDLILFQRQLALDNVPAVAVFYQGFNDLYSAYLSGVAGLPYREEVMVSFVEAGRLLRAGQPVLQLPPVDIGAYDWRLVTAGGASAAEIVDRWAGNRRLIRAAADAFGVESIFVWQPVSFAKESLTETEARILDDLDRQRPGFLQLYREADGILRERARQEAWDDLIDLAALFRDNKREIFTDEVHINEIGNRMVAEALLPSIIAALRRSAPAAD